MTRSSTHRRDVARANRSVGRLKPLSRRELATEVRTGLVLASALCLERDSSVSRCGKKGGVLA